MMGHAVAKNKKPLKNSNRDIKLRNEFDGKLPEKHFPDHDITQRQQLLSKKRKQYFIDAKKAETWLKEKIPISQICNYGEDENSSWDLLKSHESFVNELEAFYSVIETLKIQSSDIKKLESEILLKGSQQNYLATEEISFTAIQIQIEAQYYNLLNLAKQRRKKFNETTKTYILLREANEHMTSIQDIINRSEVDFQKITKELDQSEFKEKYNNFQTNMRTCKIHLFFLDQIITEMTKLGKKEDALKIQTQFQALNEKWTHILKTLEPAYEKHQFCREVDEINALLREKLKTMNEMITIGHDLKTVEILQKKQEAFESDLDTVTERVLLINKRQEYFMQTNSGLVVETYSKIEEINRKWTSLIEGMTKWKQKLNMCYEIYKSLLNCHDLMERLNTRLPRLAVDFNIDNNNNNIL